MAKKNADPLAPRFDFHPYRATFSLPHLVIDEGWRTFEAAGKTTGHPGVDALLQVPGVNSVTLHRNRLIVLRDPETPWEAILPAAAGWIRSAFLDQQPFRTQAAAAPAAAPEPAAAATA